MAGDEVPVVLEEPVTTRRTTVQCPKFDSQNFELYLNKVEAWKVLGKVPKSEQGLELWYALPDSHPSDIKEKISEEVGLANLAKADGADKFLEVMKNSFKKKDEQTAYEVYLSFFKDMKKKPEESIRDFVNRFDKVANSAKKNNMVMSATVKAFKILDDAGLSETDRKLVMSDMDFAKADTLYDDAKTGLLKYLADKPGNTSSTSGIKMEPSDEVYLAKGWQPPRGGRDRGGGRGGGAGRGGRGGGGQGQRSSFPEGIRTPGGGAGGGAGGSAGGGPARGGGNRGVEGSQKKKPENPRDENGEFYTCRSCGSFRHMLGSCPDSWENMKAAGANLVEEVDQESFFTSVKAEGAQSGPFEDVVMYTGNNKEKICSLGAETIGCVLLDCGSTANVCGKAWADSYVAALSVEDKKLVEESVLKADVKRFRFGGDEVLDSVKMMKIPAMIGGKKIMMKTHVVLSKIPLLWSRPGMKKAGLMLDLPKDRALIFGKWQELQTTSVGHYALYIVPMEGKPETCLLNMPVEKEEKKAVILKLH